MRHRALLLILGIVTPATTGSGQRAAVLARIPIQGAHIVEAAFSADSRLLATAGVGCDILVRDARTGAVLQRLHSTRLRWRNAPKTRRSAR